MAAPLVTVETHIGRGRPALPIVGLGNCSKESKDRVRALCLTVILSFPIKKLLLI